MNQMQNRRRTVEEALSYLDKVKKRCNQRTYNEFLDIMIESYYRIIDTLLVKERVVSLFRGYPDLIAEFNYFLPPSWGIEVQSSGQTQTTSVPGSSLLGKNDPTSLLEPTSTFSYSSQSVPQTRFTRSNSSLRACPAAKALPGANSQPYPFTRNWRASCQNLFDSRHGAVSTRFGSGSGNDRPLTRKPALSRDSFNFVGKIRDRFTGESEIFHQVLSKLLIYHQEIDFKNASVIHKELITRELFRQCSEMLKDEKDLVEELSRILFQP